MFINFSNSASYKNESINGYKLGLNPQFKGLQSQKNEPCRAAEVEKQKSASSARISAALIRQLYPNWANSTNQNPLNNSNDKALTAQERAEIISGLDLTKTDFDNLSAQLKNADDKTFKRAVLLIADGAKFTPSQKYDKLSDLNDEQFEKALKLTLAGDSSIDINNVCRAANLDDYTFSRILTFKENGGTPEFYPSEAALSEYVPEKLAELDDVSFDNALNLIPILRKSSYILPIAANKSYYENAQRLINAGLFRNPDSYQNNYNKIRRLYPQDDKFINKFCELLNNGLICDKLSKRDADYFLNLSDSQYERMLSLLKNHNISQLNSLFEISALNEDKYGKAVRMSDDGIPEDKISQLSELDDMIYAKIHDLLAKGADIESLNVNSAKELNMQDFERMNELANFGVKSFSMLAAANNLDENQYKKAKKLAAVQLPGYDIISNASLPDDEFERELEKIKHIASLLEIDRNRQSADGEELYQFSDDEIKEMIDLLTKSGVYVSSGGKDSVNNLAYVWRNKYLTGVDALNGYTNRIIPYALNPYISKDCAPLGRWMHIDDLDAFIRQFPDTGDIYQYDKIMSFAKTLNGAEKVKGNNFSDENPLFNVKYVVYPKNQLTQAYDTGEGKYGCDEAIYKSNQKFKVLHKGFENVNNHDLYTIYMQESD